MGGGIPVKRSLAKKIADFIRESRKNKIWRCVTDALAVLVVFMTTYALILPAITLTIDSFNEGTESTEILEAVGESEDSTQGAIMLLSDDGGGTSSYVTVSNVTFQNALYNGSNYTAELTVNFSVPVNSVVSNGYKCYLYLPEGVSPPSTYDGSTLNGYDSSSNLGFTYVYKQDNDGLWYAEIDFLSDYVANKSGTLECYINFTATIDEDKVDSAGNIVLKFEYNDSYELQIPVGDIESSADNVTPNADITVMKSTGYYDASTNSITYTLYISSSRGTTDVISIEDVMTLTGDVSVGKIVVDSVQFQSYSDIYGNISSTTSLKETSSSDVSSDSYYYTTAIPSSGASMNMVLPMISGDTNENGGRYVVTYTVYLDSVGLGESGTVTNKATGKTTDTWKGGVEIESSSGDVSVGVSLDILSKSGKLNTDGTITWTIIVNADGQNIAGFTLTDDMFASIDYTAFISGISIKASDGTSYTGNDYNGFTVNQNSGITGITFKEAAGSSDGSNTNTYTIVFTAAASSTWGSYGSVTNTASLSNGDTSLSAEASVNVTGGGISKTYNSSTEGTDANTLILNWTTTASIPAGGIEAGTVMADYLGGEYDYTKTTDQWFTYDQITELLKLYQYSINFSGMKSSINSANTSSGDYTIEVYDITQESWVYLSALLDTSTASTYADHKFTAFRITFVNAVEMSSAATWTFTYNTTADTSALDGGTATSIKYQNEAWAKGGENQREISSWASHTEYATVVKMDANWNTGTSTIITTDGSLTWMVKVYLASDCTSDSFVVKDILPDNVSLTSADVAISYLSGTLTSASDSVTIKDGTVNMSINNQTVAITIPDESFDWMVNEGGGYITITYHCQLDASLLSSGNTGAEVYIGEKTNSVTVESISGAETSVYGSAEQTQDITYSEQTKSKDIVDKSASWDDANREVTYSIILNPSGEDLLGNSDTLEFTDSLTARFQQYWGIFATLNNASVKFYQIEAGTLTNGAIYIESTGTTYAADDDSIYYDKDTDTYYCKTELDVAWTYSQSTSYYNEYEGYTVHTIAANVPDETALLVEYVYSVWVDSDSNYKTTSGLTNTATLKGDSTSSSSDTRSDSYSQDSYSAGIRTTESLNLIKVDSNNYGHTLSGAVYELYWYKEGNWVSTEQTFTTDGGNFILTPDTLGDYYAANTAYYIVEITAPEGYLLDAATKYYFYWSDSSVSTTSYPVNFTTLSDVANLSTASKTIYAPNTVMPTTSVAVEKVWADKDGREISGNETTLPENVTVDLYRYASTTKPEMAAGDSGSGSSGSETASGNVTVTVSGRINSTEQISQEKTVPTGKNVTIVVNASEVDVSNYKDVYDGSWGAYQTDKTYNSVNYTAERVLDSETGTIVLTVTIDAADIESNNVTFYFSYYGCNIDSITITYEGDPTAGGSTGTDTGSTGSEEGDSGSSSSNLLTSYIYKESDVTSVASDTEYVGTYTITPDQDGNWLYTVSNLDAMYYDVDGTAYYYYYYFVEKAVSGYDTYYKSADGTASADEAFSILNVEMEGERTYTSIAVNKNWVYNGSSDTVLDDAKSCVTFNLYRINTKDDTVAELTGSVILDGIADEYEITGWTYTWTDLIQSVTDGMGEVTAQYEYYIVEEYGSSSGVTSVAYSVDSVSCAETEISTSESGVATSLNAYKIDVSAGSMITVSVTNTVEKPVDKTISAQKVWMDYDGNVLTGNNIPENVRVTFTLYFSDGTNSYPYGGSFDANGKYVEDANESYSVILNGSADETTIKNNNPSMAGGIEVGSDGWSVTWSGLSGYYDYYVVETIESEKYIVCYTIDENYVDANLTTDAASLSGKTASDDTIYVINRVNTKTTDTSVTVNKKFASGSDVSGQIFLQLWQVATTDGVSESAVLCKDESSISLTADGNSSVEMDDNGYIKLTLSDSDTEWSVEISDLQSTVSMLTVDSNGKVTESKTTYTYYIVETGVKSADSMGDYTASYSVTACMNVENGMVAYSVESDGSITITNTQKTTTSILLEKDWLISGKQIDSPSNATATFSLWRVATYTVESEESESESESESQSSSEAESESESGSQTDTESESATGTTYTLTVNHNDGGSCLTYSVAAEKEIVIQIESTGTITGYYSDDAEVVWTTCSLSSLSITIDASKVTKDIVFYYYEYTGNNIVTVTSGGTIVSEGSGTSSGNEGQSSETESETGADTSVVSLSSITCTTSYSRTYNGESNTEDTVTGAYKIDVSGYEGKFSTIRIVFNTDQYTNGCIGWTTYGTWEWNTAEYEKNNGYSTVDVSISDNSLSSYQIQIWYSGSSSAAISEVYLILNTETSSASSDSPTVYAGGDSDSSGTAFASASNGTGSANTATVAAADSHIITSALAAALIGDNLVIATASDESNNTDSGYMQVADNGSEDTGGGSGQVTSSGTVKTQVECIDTVTLESGSSTGWTYEWSNLLTTGTVTVDGKAYECTYTYYISEDAATYGESQSLSDFNVSCVTDSGNSGGATTTVASTTLTYKTTDNNSNVATTTVTAYPVVLVENSVVTITFTNESTRTSIVLPSSGSVGRNQYYLLGILLMLLAILGAAMRRPVIARCLKDDYIRITTVVAGGERYRKTKFSPESADSRRRQRH